MKPQTRKVIVKQGKNTKSFAVHNLEDWQPVADHLASLLQPGSIVTLSGPMGAGKTTLVQHLARKLGAPKRATSPTFALIRIYKVARNNKQEVRTGNVECAPRVFGLESCVDRLVHVDAYRIEDEKDLVALDLDEELQEPGTAVLIEWPENIKGWIKDKRSLAVTIKM